MKKIFLLLAGAAMMLSSCESSNRTTGDAWKQYYYEVGTVLFMSVTNQIEYNLDPFEIAFRFNALMTETLLEAEKNGDPNPGITADAMNNCTAKGRLFRNATVSDQGNNVYRIENIGLMTSTSNNVLRSGTIDINTGNGTPMAPNNVWYVNLSKNAPYTISIDGTLVSIHASSYQIKTVQDNKWDIALSKYVAKISTDGEIQYNSEGSDWTGVMTITQKDNPGDQSLLGINSSSYELAISNTNSVTPSMIDEKLTVTTPTPIHIYSPSCGKTILDGSLSIRLSESDDFLDYASAEWTPNTDDSESDNESVSKKCSATLSLSCHGYDIPISSSSSSN